MLSESALETTWHSDNKLLLLLSLLLLHIYINIDQTLATELQMKKERTAVLIYISQTHQTSLITTDMMKIKNRAIETKREDREKRRKAEQ